MYTVAGKVVRLCTLTNIPIGPITYGSRDIRIVESYLYMLCCNTCSVRQCRYSRDTGEREKKPSFKTYNGRTLAEVMIDWFAALGINAPVG